MVGNLVCIEVGIEFRRSFVVQHLDASVVAKFTKERVSRRVGGTELRAGTVGEGLGVNVVFIDGE